MHNDSGFTLIEVMVATLITAMLATMGLMLLSNALRAQDQLEATLDTVQELELARAVIKADLAQISARRTRNAFGDTASVTFEGGVDFRQSRLMAFVRNGASTIGRPDAVSSLQYVEYAIEDGALVRKSRLHPDIPRDDDFTRRVLLDEVEDVTIRFLTPSGWTEEWSFPALPGRMTAPLAVGIDLTHPRYGEIETLYLTNGVG